MKIIKIIVALLFTIFAILQYNDPDPWLWVLIYGGSAAIISLDIAGINMRNHYLLAIIALVLFSFLYLQGVVTYVTEGSAGEIVESMKADKPYVEETREFFGIYIIIAAFAWFYIKGKQR